MPRHKKHPSTRARRNKASTAATLTLVPRAQDSAYAALTVAQLREEVDRRNGDGRPRSEQLRKSRSKAAYVAALTADDAGGSRIPVMSEHPSGSSWHPQTVQWWAAAWSSPMAREWDASDLYNVVVVALLYDDIWRAGSAKERKDALAEYRLQRADLGLSPYARRRLEWTIETAEEAKERGKRRGRGAPAPAPTEDSPDPRSLHLA